MNFKEVKLKIKTFINDELISLEPWIVNSEWSEKLPKLNELRDKVKEMGFWLPQVSKEYGGLGLTLEQHGEVSEILGASPYGFYVFNCQAPDAGNMEVLIETGTKEQKEKYLQPLLEGKIRSCFAMTEPNYAGSNPTRMGTTAKKEDGNYIIVEMNFTRFLKDSTIMGNQFRKATYILNKKNKEFRITAMMPHTVIDK